VRYLLDTHIVIWAMVGGKMLSDTARSILQTPGNSFYMSSASVWEVAIKHSVKPDEIPVTAEQVTRCCSRLNSSMPIYGIILTSSNPQGEKSIDLKP
jgi:PIN domain nuclease of toxin-antitoxin system